MRTRLTRIGNDLAVRLLEPLPEQLGLEENSEVELSTAEGVLTVAPVHALSDEQRFRESAEKVASKHAGLFQRLAK